MTDSGNIIDEYLVDDTILLRTVLIILLFSVALLVSSLYWDQISYTFLGEYARRGSEDVEKSVQFFSGLTYLLIPFYIFIRNLMVVTLSTLLSVTIIIPLLIILINGAIVGFVVREAILGARLLELTNTSPIIVSALVPHGSIEIPAIAIASSSAFYAIDAIRGKRKGFLGIIKRNLLLSASMLLFSAFIEAFVTPIIAVIAFVIVKAMTGV